MTSSGERRADIIRLPAWATPVTIFIAIYGLSLTINLLFGFVHQFRATPAMLDMDEGEYFGMSGQLLGGHLDLTPRRTLGYPLTLAAIRLISDNFLFLQILVAALYSLSPAMLFLLVRRLTGSCALGGLSGLALAIWPPAIFYGTSLYSETLALPIFLLALSVLPPGNRLVDPSPARLFQAGLCGVLLAVATHVRPMYLLFTPFLLIIIAWEDRRFTVAAKRLIAAAIGFLLLIAPWSAYMSHRFHHFILVTSNGGETLGGGLNPKLLEMPSVQAARLGGGSGRISWMGPGKWLPIGANGYLTHDEMLLPYDQTDRLMRTRTMAWVKAHPVDAAYIEGRKFTYMWGIYPLRENGLKQFLFGNLPTLALLILDIAGFVLLSNVRIALVRLWVLPLFVSGIGLISWGSWRFRQPADAGLVAMGVVIMLTYWRARALKRAAATG